MGDSGDCYVEVKNVTAAVQDGVAVFPDAVSTRGTKHLRELMGVVREAEKRAVLCFCVQRADVAEVRPADDIDPDYGRTLREALAAGVEVVRLPGGAAPRGRRPGRAHPRGVSVNAGAAGTDQSPARTQWPDLPPDFSMRRTSPMVMPRSTALHMS